MTDNTALNYPDILGAIAAGERLNVGVVQVAAALRPKLIRAGRPFEALMLVQNASDSPIDVTVVLHLPEQDARKQRSRFIAKVNRLVVGLQPAEVGYVTLPVNTLPDTASAPGYKIMLEVSAKPGPQASGKAARVRLPGGGGPVGPLRRDVAEQVEALKALSFTAGRRGVLRSAVELTFNLLPGKIGALADLKPGWVSLWTMQDLQAMPDNLLGQYADALRAFIGGLDRVQAYKALHERTLSRFADAGYPLRPIEASMIARLLTLMLQYARSAEQVPDKGDYPPAPELEVNEMLRHDISKGETLRMPHWVNAVLLAIGQDRRVALHPNRAAAHFAYDALLRDAVHFGLKHVERVTGEALGDADEQAAHSQQLLDALNGQEALNFSLVYLPLVAVGALLHELVTVPKEDMQALRAGIANLLVERKGEMDDDNEPVFHLAKTLIDIVLMKYGFKSEL